MGWNEQGNGKDPWGPKNNQSPPDLEEALRKFQDKLNRMMGAKSGGGGSGGSKAAFPAMGFGLIVFVLLVAYVLSGFFIVRPAEQAAVFQFKHYVTTLDSGLHWIPRFIRSKTILNVEQVLDSRHQGDMLTKDENIVSVELAVQYKISDIKDYLFNVLSPRYTLQQVTESVMRQVVGHSTLDEILTEGREVIRQQIKIGITDMLHNYQAGLEVTDVLMQPAKAPEAVKAAFDDVIKAQEEEQRSIQQARAYEKKNVPLAEGQARRLIAEAKAYATQVVLNASGDTKRFLALLPEYDRAPTVTRERLYLDTLQNVMSVTTKVVVDTTGSNNLLYLPIDKLLDKKNQPRSPAGSHESTTTSALSTRATTTASTVSPVSRSSIIRTNDRSRFDRER